MNRRAVVGLAVLAVTGTAAAAGIWQLADQPPPPSHGYVLSKDHQDAYDWPQTICAGYDQRGTCTATVTITWHEPDHWILCLVADDRRDYRGCLYVAPDVWERYRPGDHYPEPR